MFFSHLLSSLQNNALLCQAADFSAIKELDSLSNEIMDLQRWEVQVFGITGSTISISNF